MTSPELATSWRALGAPGGGDDYSRVVIIITDLTDTDDPAFNKCYNIMATTE
jgi:hypothetical protein